MKRELNSRSRRKWVAGGVLVFGSVALLSTGFATWVIGASQTAYDQNIGVTVDTVKDNSFILTAELKTPGDSLKLGETSEVTSGFVQTEGAVVGDYTVVLTLKVEKGEQGAPTGAPTFVLDNTKNAAKNLIATNAAGLITDPVMTRGTPVAVSESNYYTILAVSSNNGLADWVETGSAGDWAYTRDYEVTFTNGTVFNSNASIAAFYNSVFNSRDHSTKAAINSDKALITGELDAIEGVVSGGIVLTVSLAS